MTHLYQKSKISFDEAASFGKIVLDYQKEVDQIREFITDFPSMESLKDEADKFNFPMDRRYVLKEVLLDQYSNIDCTEKTKANINALEKSNSYTVVTGHQICLFTGPLYFIYKIASTISLTRRLSEKHTDKHFIPIYWMATEDHDFEEINHFNFFKDKLQWDSDQGGMVGAFNTSGLDSLKSELAQIVPDNELGAELIELFEKSYGESDNLADATRKLVDSLFGKYGLVILDANDKRLKKLASNWMKLEIREQFALKSFEKQLGKWPEEYKVQVHAREINLFYVLDSIRERIVLADGVYEVLNTEIRFTEDEILKELEIYPERFSPNVILRPLYQETILPNIAYIGGGGEIAYWLLLKEVFQTAQTAFPLLIVRDSVVLLDRGIEKKQQKLVLSDLELFQDPQEILKERAKDALEGMIELNGEKSVILAQYEQIKEKIAVVDKNLQKTVQTDMHKFLKSFEQLEAKIIRAEKRKNQDMETQIWNLKDRLFPQGKMQERHQNFSVFYQKWGSELIDFLVQELNPLDKKFRIISEKED